MVEFHGIAMRGPVLAASGPATETPSNIRACEFAGAGAVMLKSVAGERLRSKTAFAPRRVHYRDGTLYMLSSCRREFLGVEHGEFLTAQAKSETSLPVVASAAGDVGHFDEWASALKRLSAAGADMLQLDTLYCFASDGQDATRTLRLLRIFAEEVQRDLACPVVLKLTPEVPVETAKAVLTGTPVGLVILDSLAVGLPVDPLSNSPAFRGVQSFGPCRAAGRILFPLVTLYAQELGAMFPGRLCAGGGIFSDRDAAWILNLGATCVQVATAICVFGFRRLSDIVSGLAMLPPPGHIPASQFVVRTGMVNFRTFSRKQFE